MHSIQQHHGLTPARERERERERETERGEAGINACESGWGMVTMRECVCVRARGIVKEGMLEVLFFIDGSHKKNPKNKNKIITHFETRIVTPS